MHLELVDVTQEELSALVSPRGAVAYNALRWVNLFNGEAALRLAAVPEIDRVGVSIYYAGQYVGYREGSLTEAREMVAALRKVGFDGEGSL